MKISLVTHNADRIKMIIDPHAKGFFQRMGVSLVRFADNGLSGRKVPVYEYRLPR
jgi:hypothetical protein